MPFAARGKHIRQRIDYLNAQLEQAKLPKESTRTRAERAVKTLKFNRKREAEAYQSEKTKKEYRKFERLQRQDDVAMNRYDGDYFDE